MSTPIEQRREVLRQPDPRTLDGMLDHCAELRADHPLVITDSRTLSYEQVAEWSI